MRILVTLLLLGLVIGGGIYFLGDRDPDPSDGEVIEGPDGPGVSPEGNGNLIGAAPRERPDLEVFALDETVGVLMVVGVPQRLNAQLAIFWQRNPKIDLTTWAVGTTDTGAGEVPASALPAGLRVAPTAANFADFEIDVLVVHDMDPSALDDAFWNEAMRRVDAGRLGLLVVPGILHGREMLDHPILGPYLPVAKAAAIEGQPVPGVYPKQVPFEITTYGQRHPATRLVSWPSWSRTIWTQTRTLETPWGTEFCYPVEELAEGAVTLVQADPPTTVDPVWPAIVAGNPAQGRVLWLGTWDLGQRHAYGRPDVVSDWRALATNWVAWLSGRVDEEDSPD